MSAVRAIWIVCDECGRDAYYETASKREARRQAKADGWTVNVSTRRMPSHYDVRADVCRWCEVPTPRARAHA